MAFVIRLYEEGAANAFLMPMTSSGGLAAPLPAAQERGCKAWTIDADDETVWLTEKQPLYREHSMMSIWGSGALTKTLFVLILFNY